jgi:carbonic anhydrase
MATQPPTTAPLSDPEAALQQLLAGNQRYCNAQYLHPHLNVARRQELAGGQKPFALVFSCVDSRVPPELVFDQGLGDLFVIRTAGHVLDRAAFGSIEFGVAELGIKLLVVLGHEKCGAIAATITALSRHEAAPSHIGALVEGITPAVEQARAQAGDLLHNSVAMQVAMTIRQLGTSPILRAALEQNSIKIVGARYHLDTGAVEILPTA